jgi:hypothetical protein
MDSGIIFEKIFDDSQQFPTFFKYFGIIFACARQKYVDCITKMQEKNMKE